jgi:enoyl-CoA hydratase/carnithine racemase
MADGRILIEKTEGVGRIAIDHERRRNALTLRMWSDVALACAAFEVDPGIRVVTLRGTGGVAFSSGADISEFATVRATPEATLAYERVVLEAHLALGRLSKPTIALVDGLCFGGGMGLAMACDVRLGSDRSTFCIPAARLGIGYGLEDILRLASRIGVATTADLLLSGAPIGAAEARAGGILQRLWSASEFDARAKAYVASMSGNAPLTMAAVKQALAAIEIPISQEDARSIARLVAACDSSKDFREGQAAFREKRPPRFSGT